MISVWIFHPNLRKIRTDEIVPGYPTETHFPHFLEVSLTPKPFVFIHNILKINATLRHWLFPLSDRFRSDECKLQYKRNRSRRSCQFYKTNFISYIVEFNVLLFLVLFWIVSVYLYSGGCASFIKLSNFLNKQLFFFTTISKMNHDFDINVLCSLYVLYY